MSKQEQYQIELRGLRDWKTYLEANSNLPGPRANLELAYAVGLEADVEQALALIDGDIHKPAGDSPQVFPILCGVISLARQSGLDSRAKQLARKYASDERWRLREAVALGMQFRGDTDITGLLDEMQGWMEGNLYEQRAVVASLCEPRLLKEALVAGKVIRMLEQITHNLLGNNQKKSDGFRVLRQALGYGWSVAIVSSPDDGKSALLKWAGVKDPHILWIIRENLKKNRLIKLDPEWVSAVTRLIQ